MAPVLRGKKRTRASNFGRRTAQFFCRIRDGGPKIALRFCPQLFPCGEKPNRVAAQRATLCFVRITNAFYRVIYRAVNITERYNSEVQSLKGQNKEQEKLFLNSVA